MEEKLFNCKYCHLSFDSSKIANHSRWCIDNPKRIDYIIAAQLRINSGKSNLHTNETNKKRNESIKLAWKDGKYINAANKSVQTRRQNGTIKHTERTKLLLREKALASSHRRLTRSIRNYTKSDGTIIQLDSSWEEALAKRLDLLKIDWIRPEPIKWIDKHQNKRNYFPDFYLPKYNLYLDPKNPAAYKNQLEKITALLHMYKNVVFLKTLDECNNFAI